MNPPYRPDSSQPPGSLLGGSGYHPAPGHPGIAAPAPPNPYALPPPQRQSQHQPQHQLQPQHQPQHQSQHQHPHLPPPHHQPLPRHGEHNHLPPVTVQPLPPPSQLQQPHPPRPLHPPHREVPQQHGHHPPHAPPATSTQPQESRAPRARADQKPLSLTPLEATSLVLNGLRYTLVVGQQPERARMCGYGDKDRRPITPPPCVRLFITDIKTGRSLSPSKSDFAFFVLSVDLWNEAGTEEVNLCRQPSSAAAHSVPVTPSGYSYSFNGGGSGSAHGSYAPANYPHQPVAAGYPPEYQSQQTYNPVASPYSHDGGGYAPPQQYFPPNQQYRTSEQSMPISSVQNAHENGSPMTYAQDQYKGALNRNLIGSVSASAFHLHDPQGEEGMWFVLQDLSVRLEGNYRLKFSFINVGPPLGAENHSSSQNPSQSSSQVVTGRAPILASCFSNKFAVYSAKKFPGVCESTLLSKTFATQGIKIPIRKDGNKGGDEDEGE
ncbi:hypothetical protein N3K66_006018 [Trichothecium roseum]|uniref:Uncharacterized protein n=1 Tax=Trichothecium roseum TaxID=47278 RepID=A0ACC0UZH4_9HYPO|nr:hypothetical protein N3K66_006018 [Trichothecium roseum]